MPKNATGPGNGPDRHRFDCPPPLSFWRRTFASLPSNHRLQILPVTALSTQHVIDSRRQGEPELTAGHTQRWCDPQAKGHPQERSSSTTHQLREPVESLVLLGCKSGISYRALASSLTWDEENLAATEIGKDSLMKITEPKTPYVRSGAPL